MEEIIIVKPKKKYSESAKKASKKYLEKNRDSINMKRKIYYLKRKLADPEYLVYKRIKAREQYHKKKILKLNRVELPVIAPNNLQGVLTI